MSGVTREVENAYLSETLDSAFLIMHVNVSCYRGMYVLSKFARLKDKYPNFEVELKCIIVVF